MAQNSEVKDIFIRMLMFSCGCIFSRLTPRQKADLIRLVKKNNQGVVTMAIGDGANDSNMMIESDVGIGLVKRPKARFMFETTIDKKFIRELEISVNGVSVDYKKMRKDFGMWYSMMNFYDADHDTRDPKFTIEVKRIDPKGGKATELICKKVKSLSELAYSDKGQFDEVKILDSIDLKEYFGEGEDLINQFNISIDYMKTCAPRTMVGDTGIKYCDVYISEFRMVQKLLFNHGNDFYKSNSEIVLYLFYKSILLLVPQF
jgi:magnesium-transporting ATPase (P-type)